MSRYTAGSWGWIGWEPDLAVTFLLKGYIIGLSIAAPVGPIGVLCIRRTLAEGRSAGLAAGLGAATADAIYGCIAGFGLTILSGFLVSQQMWLRLIGGLFLCYLGVRTLFARPAERPAPARGVGLGGVYASTLFLTLTNPMTILAFAAVFAGLGLAGAGGDYVAASLLIGGVFLGSASWWALLSGGVSLLRNRFGPSGLTWVNRISGAVIMAFGLAALVGARPV